MAQTTKPGSLQEEQDNQNTDEEVNNVVKILDRNNENRVDFNLLSMENIDRNSPEIWEESKFQDVKEFMDQYTPAYGTKAPYTTEFSADDKQQIQNLRNLSTGALILKVKELHDIAYQLGVEESKEMTRGMYLNMFNRSIKKE